MATEAGGAALESSSPTVAEWVGEQFGDMIPAAEPEPTADAPSATTSDPATPEGTEASATEPVVAETTVPDSSTPSTEPDPLEGASPFTYAVNGQERTFDGITWLKDGGGIIDPEAKDKIVRVFGERDHLYEQNQSRHQENQALSRLTEWQTIGANGEKVMLSGREGVEAQRVTMAQMAAEIQAYRTLHSDPNNLREILVGNEDGSLAWNALGVKAFLAELKNAQNEHSAKARASLAGLTTAAQPAAFNPSALASPATAKAVELTGAKGFTAEDTKWAEALAPRFVRLATSEDQQANPALVVGQPMIEQQFLDLVKERGELRASTGKTVSSAAQVAKDNAARIAAAKTGQKPGQQPAKITPPKEPERTRDDDFYEQWERQQKAAAGALRTHASGVGR